MEKSDKMICIENSPKTLDAWTKALGEILASSLSQQNIDEQISMTPSIKQDTTGLNMIAENFQMTFQLAVEKLYEEWPFSEFDYNTKRWPTCETLISHISTLEQIYFAADSFQQSLKVSAEFARLLMDVGWSVCSCTVFTLQLASYLCFF